MASNEAITSGNDGDMIELIEDDIPGAKLTGAVDGYTMSELKWWLLCRGVKAPNSWNKKQLSSFHTQCFLKAGLYVVILSVPLPLSLPLPGIPS